MVIATVRRAIAGSLRPLRRRRWWRWRRCNKIRRIKVVLAGDADQREEGLAARVGEGCPHALRVGGFGDGTDRPVRGDPFARRMRQRGGETDEPRGLIYGGGLDRCDLMLTESFAHNVETARERRIAEASLRPSATPGADRCG